MAAPCPIWRCCKPEVEGPQTRRNKGSAGIIGRNEAPALPEEDCVAVHAVPSKHVSAIETSFLQKYPRNPAQSRAILSISIPHPERSLSVPSIHARPFGPGDVSFILLGLIEARSTSAHRTVVFFRGESLGLTEAGGLRFRSREYASRWQVSTTCIWSAAASRNPRIAAIRSGSVCVGWSSSTTNAPSTSAAAVMRSAPVSQSRDARTNERRQGCTSN